MLSVAARGDGQKNLNLLILTNLALKSIILIKTLARERVELNINRKRRRFEIFAIYLWPSQFLNIILRCQNFDFQRYEISRVGNTILWAYHFKGFKTLLNI